MTKPTKPQIIEAAWGNMAIEHPDLTLAEAWQVIGPTIPDDEPVDAVQRFTTAHAHAHHAIRTGTVTADHFRELGDAYGEHLKARTS